MHRLRSVEPIHNFPGAINKPVLLPTNGGAYIYIHTRRRLAGSAMGEGLPNVGESEGRQGVQMWDAQILSDLLLENFASFFMFILIHRSRSEWDALSASSPPPFPFFLPL